MPITEKTRQKWNDKIQAIKQAREIGVILIYPDEPAFLKRIELKLSMDYDLKHRESKWLNRIYERIK